jgi:hypothetical protein
LEENELLEQKIINAASKRMFESLESYITLEIRKNPNVTLDEIKFKLLSIYKPRIIKMTASTSESRSIENIITDFINRIYLHNINIQTENEFN